MSNTYLRVCVFSRRYPACKCARAILSLVVCPYIQYLSRFSHKSHDFRKKKYYWIKNVCFDFLHNLCAKRELRFPPLLHTSYIRDCRSALLNYRCLLKVLCPVRRPITTLDCVLLQDSSLVLAVGLEPGINFRICLCVLITCLKQDIFNIKCFYTFYCVYPDYGPSWPKHVVRIKFRVLLYVVLCNAFGLYSWTV
jgi:hypothetical protein